MEYKPLTTEQRELLKESIQYNPDTDFNGAKGTSLADRLGKGFGENIPRISFLTEKKIEFYEIINSIDSTILYNKMQRTLFRGVFGKLKKAGYRCPDGSEMKDYNKMDTGQMWGYHGELKEELDIFKKEDVAF